MRAGLNLHGTEMVHSTFQVSAEVVQALLHAAKALILRDVPIGHHEAILALLILILLILQIIILHGSTIARLSHSP